MKAKRLQILVIALPAMGSMALSGRLAVSFVWAILGIGSPLLSPAAHAQTRPAIEPGRAIAKEQVDGDLKTAKAWRTMGDSHRHARYRGPRRRLGGLESPRWQRAGRHTLLVAGQRPHRLRCVQRRGIRRQQPESVGPLHRRGSPDLSSRHRPNNPFVQRQIAGK
jgi:hypothetical protein